MDLTTFLIFLGIFLSGAIVAYPVGYLKGCLDQMQRLDEPVEFSNKFWAKTQKFPKGKQ